MVVPVIKWLIITPFFIFGALVVIGTIDNFVFGGVRATSWADVGIGDYIRVIIYSLLGVIFPIYSRTQIMINEIRNDKSKIR